MKVNRKYVWTGGALASGLLVFLWWGWDGSDHEPTAKDPDRIVSVGGNSTGEDGKRSPEHTRAELKARRQECRALLREAAANGVPDPDTSHLDGCSGKMPLHYARTSEQIQLLLDNGADPNAQDIHGSTPLHLQMVRIALVGGEDGISIVQKLLEAGADPWATCHHGKLPIQVAQMQTGLFRPARLLEKISGYLKAAGISRSEEADQNPDFKKLLSQLENRDTVASNAISELMAGMVRTAPPWLEIPESIKERMG